MTAAVDFLADLMDGTHPHSLCTAADNEERWLGSVGFYTDRAELLAAADNLTRKRQAAWFSVHPLKAALTPPARGGDNDVALVRCLAADIDWLHPAHKDTALLPEAEVRARFARFEFKPTYLVDTGHGLQAYWRLDCDITPERGWALTCRMHLALEALGLKVERGDLASVLRVPGTFNWKREPVEAAMSPADPQLRYLPEHLEKRLPGSGTVRPNGNGKGYAELDREALDPLDLAALTLLEAAGGHNAYVTSKGTISVSHTGHKAKTGAAIGYSGPGTVRFFTTSWKPYKADTTYDLDDLERLGNGHGDPDPRPRYHSTLLADVTPEQVTWLWPGRLPRGKLVVLDGDPDVGKSTLTVDITARLTTGQPMPGEELACVPPSAVVLMAAEDGLADTVRPRLDAAGADTSRVHHFDAVSRADDDGNVHWQPPSIPEDVATLEALIVETGAVFVVVDVLMAYLSGRADSHRDQDVRRALAELADVADRTGACIILLRHRKSRGAAMYAGGGSIGIIGGARAGLVAAVDPDDETGQRRVLAVVKSNLALKPPALAYTLVGDGPTSVARVEWLGESKHTADSLMAISDHEQRSELQRCIDFLNEHLNGDEHLSRDLDDAARNGHGFSVMTLRRAKKQLGVESFQRDRKWWLRLPSEVQVLTHGFEHLNSDEDYGGDDDDSDDDDGDHGERSTSGDQTKAGYVSKYGDHFCEWEGCFLTAGPEHAYCWRHREVLEQPNAEDNIGETTPEPPDPHPEALF